ncbi:DNA-binding protein WhiA [Anaerosacchariphilus polymeriproducens]|uniref:Probable cell division protein WhiA n=1 Tax=Anaerosacchariphilus polymeriproducens TaxID=1812858 RepID=A0A371AT16_9FIRM|nr:DNA-binding protein WhiA [Anaerosacchariphilus polymeriproducens]RDU22717.1 DNA-binding protein WhiA [Anaerosacchariphilus polymeriproducens]
MSFSSQVKDELSRQISKARHCQIAEIAAIISLCGKVQISVEDEYRIQMFTENVAIARKYFTLLKKTFNINTEISIRRNNYLNKSRTYILTVKNHDEAIMVLQAVKLLGDNSEIKEEMSLVNNLVIQKSCCRRAFIRGAFLATGSISDPEKFYHFEIVCATIEKAEQLQEIINSFQMDAKIVQRKKYYVVYLKEGAQIVDILNVMEAHIALMELENVRILKEMRNTVNRKVNCETANINKTVNAAVKQIQDIRLLEEKIGFDGIPDGLKAIAELRLEFPEATLKELGGMLNPPVGKSGVNHRLRKLSDLAEEFRA